MINPRARRWLLGAATLVLASGVGCTAVDCPSGSTIRSGQCSAENPDTTSDAAVDPTTPQGGSGGTGAAAESGTGGASGAAAEGGSSAGRAAEAGAGGAGTGAVAGTGGAGGSGGASGASAAEPCTTAGAVRCSALGEGKREACTDGKWQPSEACAAGQTCVVDAGGSGACVTRAEVCRGSGGKAVCDAQGTLFVCNADESIKSQTMCQSARLCQAGRAAQTCAVCVPTEEHRCTGKTLERCAADGMSFAKLEDCATAALCNKTAGMCTDSVCVPNKAACDGNTLLVCNADGTGWKSMTPCGGGTCDAAGGDCNECEPGSKKCDAQMVLTCDAAGQTYTPSSCPSGDHCVGLGQCVDCVSNADCAALTQGCKVGVCNAQNRCVEQNQPGGTSCTAAGNKPGVCASGICQCAPQCAGKECGDNGCNGTCPPGCSGTESCVANQCVECQNDGQCSRLNAGNGCVEGYCDAGTCKARNAPSTKACGASGTCRDGSCCTPSCSGKCAGESNGCGGTCPNPCGSGQSCSAGNCCTPECDTRCSGSNGCGGTCTQSNCSAQGLVCQSGECIPPPSIGGLYQPCDDANPCNSQYVCTQVGPGGSFCYVPVSSAGTCTPPLVSFLSFVCLGTCPGADADKRSPGCPAGAKMCYGASADTGYCVPKTQ
ncbi:MAG TPA: hypothetical protein VJR89_36705 [Polyangiales bacterium]|nr:hypothetical protein [Polyangiales bacterium]